MTLIWKTRFCFLLIFQTRGDSLSGPWQSCVCQSLRWVIIIMYVCITLKLSKPNEICGKVTSFTAPMRGDLDAVNKKKLHHMWQKSWKYTVEYLNGCEMSGRRTVSHYQVSVLADPCLFPCRSNAHWGRMELRSIKGHEFYMCPCMCVHVLWDE